MHISKVVIRNYRNFRNAEFRFEKGINTIIGENGSGKTNLFRALRLILDDNLYRYAYKLDEGDFNRSLDDWRGHWIIISVEFSELSDREAIQALFIHGVGNIENGFVDKATYNLFFRPKKEIRKKLSELADYDYEGLNKILSALTIDDYETVFTGKSTADFTSDEDYNELVGDFENISFAFDFDETKFGIKIPNQLSVTKEISFTFIQALRDVLGEFSDSKNNPLLRLLKTQSDKIDEEDFKHIANKVDELNNDIENLNDIKNIRIDIKDTIKETVGETYSPSSLSIKSSLSNEAEKLLKSLRLFIGEPEEDHEGDIYELSLGGANLIYLTLKLLEYKYRKSIDTLANFLIIEEPEAHLHTHIQKALFDKLDFVDTQIIYSTHSPQISEVSQISRMNILAKKRNYAEVFHPANGLGGDDVTKLERYLDGIRSNLLFAKGVILVEGDAEELLIPVMVKEVFGISLDEMGISLINIRSIGFQNVAQIFNDERIRRRCAIVTDLDTAISEENQESERQGEKRKEKLDGVIKNNVWVNAFYAEYTFEVDFIKNENVIEVEALIDEVYKDKRTKEIAAEELNSDKIEEAGKRILTMADHVGKGWFAIMLGKHITYKTNIPGYILDAIVFAKSSFSPETIVYIAKYRTKNLQYYNKEFDEQTEAYYSRDINQQDYLDYLKSTLEDDAIIDLLERL